MVTHKIVYILKNEQVYGHDCDASNEITNVTDISRSSRLYEQLNNTFELNGDCADVCSVQDSKFNTIFVVAITTYEIATAFYGLLFDTIGTGYTRILITISETIGLVFLFFVDENNPDYLYPGTILISMSGIMVLGRFHS